MNAWLPVILPLASVGAVVGTFVSLGLFFTKVAEIGGKDLGVWYVVASGLVIIILVPAIGFILSRRNPD